MKPNLGSFDRFVRFFLGAAFLFAAVALFAHPLLRILSAAFGLFSFWEGFSSRCPLQAHLVARSSAKPSQEAASLLGLIGIQALFAYEWLSAGYEKVIGPEFVAGLQGTLVKFASGNPFPWYKAYLTGFASEHATALGDLVQWGEVAVGFGLAVGLVWFLNAKDDAQARGSLWLMSAALIGGMLMSLNFYLAAGWTSPSTHGLNLLMFWVQACLAFSWLSRLTPFEPARKTR